MTGPAAGLASLNCMETWDAIRARRNVRSYDDRSIAPEHLDRILEAGRRAPSASNRQKWDFVLVTDPGQLQELSTVWVGASHLATAKAAIVLVLPVPESERYRTIDQYDLGQATMVMMLAATDLGIGSGHSAIGDQEACRRIRHTGRPPMRLHDCSRLSGRPTPEADGKARPTSLRPGSASRQVVTSAALFGAAHISLSL